jgi:uncharacterized membrane protein YkvA (DUF1232 family)
MDSLKRIAALLADPRVKKLPRFAVLAAIVYVISPIDLVPDFIIPVVGWLDDATLVWLSLRWLLKSDPEAPKQLE